MWATIENLKHSEMLDPLGQAWQNGSALAAKTIGRVAVSKQRLCSSLWRELAQIIGADFF